MDTISIDKLKIYCNHGVFRDEQINGQNFYVSARLGVDTYQAGITDDLGKSVNYAELSHVITDYMQNNRYNLIEAVANNLAAHIFKYSKLIRELTLTIYKPEAPVGLPLENVSVTITRKWHTAYIALGSNIGDSMLIIRSALDAMKNNASIRVIKESSLINTKPYGGVEQPDFINGVVQIETYLEPDNLLTYLNTLEKEAGRTREIHWGPRTLDLDILLYDEQIINTSRLMVPHIDMANRFFVLEPLCEIAPYAYNARLNRTAAELLYELQKRTER